MTIPYEENARMEFRYGYNRKRDKYFLWMIDVDTQDNMRMEFKKDEFLSIAKDMIKNVELLK